MIYIILGTKGQFMKMFPIMKLFDKFKIPYKFIHTCQHYGIIEENRKIFKIKSPNVYLTHKEKDLKSIWDFLFWAPKVLINGLRLPIKSSDHVIIHGDCESTLLGLIIGKFFRAKIVHIEAGERTGKLGEPFPEELIRIISDKFSDVCFCSYDEFKANIKDRKEIYSTSGNTIFDSVRLALQHKQSLAVRNLINQRYVLFLIHRKESLFFKKKLVRIIDILESILERGFKIIWLMHENTTYELKKKELYGRLENLKRKYKLEIRYFLNYVDLIYAIKNSEFIASDGGGLQDETYFLNKPLLILRNVVEQNYNISKTCYLSMFDRKKINYFLDNYSNFKTSERIKKSPSKIIVDYFREMLKK